MIQGSQIQKEAEKTTKEINRAQSMKPIAEPLIDKQENGKSLYWKLNSNLNDDKTTVVLEKQSKDLVSRITAKGDSQVIATPGAALNADISYNEMTQNAHPLNSQLQASEELPY